MPYSRGKMQIYIANVCHVVFAVLDRNQFGLIRLTFFNKSLSRPFSVETGLHVGLVVTWGTITGTACPQRALLINLVK